MFSVCHREVSSFEIYGVFFGPEVGVLSLLALGGVELGNRGGGVAGVGTETIRAMLGAEVEVVVGTTAAGRSLRRVSVEWKYPQRNRTMAAAARAT